MFGSENISCALCPRARRGKAILKCHETFRRRKSSETHQHYSRQNGDKPKRRHSKTATTKPATHPKRRHAKTATHPNRRQPRRRHAKTATHPKRRQPRRRQPKRCMSVTILTCRRFGFIQNGDTSKRRQSNWSKTPCSLVSKMATNSGRRHTKMVHVAVLTCRLFGLVAVLACRRFGLSPI